MTWWFRSGLVWPDRKRAGETSQNAEAPRRAERVTPGGLGRTPADGRPWPAQGSRGGRNHKHARIPQRACDSDLLSILPREARVLPSPVGVTTPPRTSAALRLRVVFSLRAQLDARSSELTHHWWFLRLFFFAITSHC